MLAEPPSVCNADDTLANYMQEEEKAGRKIRHDGKAEKDITELFRLVEKITKRLRKSIWVQSGAAESVHNWKKKAASTIRVCARGIEIPQSQTAI
ncbi:MAG: hypothetical protein ACTTKL_10145 [Treponema sp.]